MKAPVQFPLYLRIPAWADGATFTYRGESVPCRAGTLFKVARTWQPDDECLLTLPMEVRTEPRLNNSIAVLRGPLVLFASHRAVVSRSRQQGILGNPPDHAVELWPGTDQPDGGQE